jgi:hypothetical protein
MIFFLEQIDDYFNRRTCGIRQSLEFDLAYLLHKAFRPTTQQRPAEDLPAV